MADIKLLSDFGEDAENINDRRSASPFIAEKTVQFQMEGETVADNQAGNKKEAIFLATVLGTRGSQLCSPGIVTF
jgi:hypothetical protein